MNDPLFDFWCQSLAELCIRERFACRPFSRLFSTMAYARLESADQDRGIRDRCRESGIEVVSSIGGKPMIAAEDFYRAFVAGEGGAE